MSNETTNIDLSQLSQKQLAELRDQATLLIKVDASAVDPLVFDAVKVCLGQLGVKDVPPLSVILRGPQAKAFKDASAELSSYVKTYFKPTNRTYKTVALRLCIQSLFRWMIKIGCPVTMRTAIQQLAKAPEAIEREFPGYRQSGFLPVLLRSKQSTERLKVAV